MIIVVYSVLFFLLGVYSFSQIDLNLTLSSNSTYQAIQYQMIQLGYYNRPASAYLFIGILAGLFLLYWYTMHLVSQGKMSSGTVRYIIAASVLLGIFSYPAFSHDLFNYMFDARIVTAYGQNPYLHSAQDFPQDLWVRFMHWTHRTYPYGPLWLVLTIPISSLGMGKFIVTLALYKLMFATFHIGNILLIRRISQHKTHIPSTSLRTLEATGPLQAVATYALNPLVIIESLVSPHNEVIMAFFLLAALYFLQKKQTAWSIGNLLLSGGIKFITWILLPVFVFHKQLKKRWGSDGFLIVTILTLLIPISYVIWQREPYPWYALPLLAVATLISHRVWIRMITTGISLGLVLRYAPYVYFGDYTDQMRMWQNGTFFFILFITALLGAWFLMEKRSSKT